MRAHPEKSTRRFTIRGRGYAGDGLPLLALAVVVLCFLLASFAAAKF
jgi:hypothetical protein